MLYLSLLIPSVFITHLYMFCRCRLCTECLSSLIEINQFQKYVIEKLDQNQINKDLSNIKITEFPKNIPISSIIEDDELDERDTTNKDNTDLFQAKLKAHKLYKKYIEDGCKYEINISFGIKQPLINILHCKKLLLNNNNINLLELILLFESIKSEMKKLLMSSFDRFRHENEFEIIMKLFNNKKKIKQDKLENNGKPPGIQIVYTN